MDFFNSFIHELVVCVRKLPSETCFSKIHFNSILNFSCSWFVKSQSHIFLVIIQKKSSNIKSIFEINLSDFSFIINNLFKSTLACLISLFNHSIHFSSIYEIICFDIFSNNLLKINSSLITSEFSND